MVGVGTRISLPKIMIASLRDGFLSISLLGHWGGMPIFNHRTFAILEPEAFFSFS